MEEDLHEPIFAAPKTQKSFFLCFSKSNEKGKKGKGNLINKIPLIFQHVKW